MDMLVALIQGLMTKFPIITSVLTIVGIARLIFKPLFTFLQAVADATPTDKDNQAIQKVEQSGAYKTVAFLLDYLGSIKIIK